MALINEIIPQQGFEIVRDTIGAVLQTELVHQQTLQPLTDTINVFVGRNTPFQQQEVLMINVLVDSADYSNYSEKSVHESTNYFIDVYSSGKESSSENGGLNATKRRDQYLGLIRSILQDHHYKTLGLPLGLIMGTYIEGFEMFNSAEAQDSSFVKMGRLTFSVRIVENQTLWQGVNICDIFTEVKLCETERGYQYHSLCNNGLALEIPALLG